MISQPARGCTFDARGLPAASRAGVAKEPPASDTIRGAMREPRGPLSPSRVGKLRSRVLGTAGLLLLVGALCAPAGSPEQQRAGENTMTQPQALHSLAEEFYQWRYEENPVAASDAGRHDRDDKLTDYSPAAISRRQARLADFRRRYGEISTSGWDAGVLADHELFGAALEREVFADEVLRRGRGEPPRFVDAGLYWIFSLLKKEEDTKTVRARR